MRLHLSALKNGFSLQSTTKYKKLSNGREKNVPLFQKKVQQTDAYAAQFGYVHANLCARHDHNNARDLEEVHHQKNALVRNRLNVHYLDEFQNINDENKQCDQK